MNATDTMTVCECQIQYDASGVGNAWQPATADNCPVTVQEEIAAEIIDGKQESCDDYLASNGQHYRW